MSDTLLSRLLKAERDFSGTSYQGVVKEAQDLFCRDMFEEASKVLCKLPSDAELLRELIDKLKGKSVYKTLRRIDEGRIKSTAEVLKGLFSLGTHIVIECEKGKGEFRALLPIIHNKIGEMIYEVV
jgi:hypothetical protein